MSAMNYVNMTQGALIAELLERDGECVRLSSEDGRLQGIINCALLACESCMQHSISQNAKNEAEVIAGILRTATVSEGTNRE